MPPDKQPRLQSFERSILPPKGFEPFGRQSGIANRVGNRLVPKVVLYSSGIYSIIRQLEAGGMAKHVGVNRKTDLRGFPKPCQHFPKASGREWGPSFTGKYELASRLLFFLQPPQRPDFFSVQYVGGWRTVLDTAHMDLASVHINLVPPKIA